MLIRPIIGLLIRPIIGLLIRPIIGLLIRPIIGLLLVVAGTTIIGGTITVIVVVSACRSYSYCSGPNAHGCSAINSTVGISPAINSTVGNASVIRSYSSVIHSYTTACTSKSIG